MRADRVLFEADWEGLRWEVAGTGEEFIASVFFEGSRYERGGFDRVWSVTLDLALALEGADGPLRWFLGPVEPVLGEGMEEEPPLRRAYEALEALRRAVPEGELGTWEHLAGSWLTAEQFRALARLEGWRQASGEASALRLVLLTGGTDDEGWDLAAAEGILELGRWDPEQADRPAMLSPREAARVVALVKNLRAAAPAA